MKVTLPEFKLPVGNVFCWGTYKLIDETKMSKAMPMHVYKPTEGYEHLAYSAPWWINKNFVKDILVPKGFKLHVGVALYNYPGVIDKENERCANGIFHVNTRGEEARDGDVLVYMTIEDVDEAQKYLVKNARVDCYVCPDLDLYSTNDFYKQVYDRANYYFMYYYINKTSLDLFKVKEITDEELYDV